MSAKTSDNGVKPQIIDLEADAVSEIEDKQEARPEQTSENAPNPPKPAQKKKSYNWPLPAAALIAGAIGGGWFYKDVLLNYVPPAQVTAAQQALAKLEQQQADQSGTIAKLQQAIEQQDATTQQVKADLAASDEASASTNQSTLAHIVEMDKALSSLAQDVAKLKQQPAPSSPSGPVSVDLAPIEQRVAALEKQLEELQSAKPAANQTLATFAALRSKLTAGEPFEAELKSFAAATPAIAIPEEISASAAKGASTPSQLGAELRTLATAPATAPEPEETGLWSSIKKSMSGLVTIKNAGPADWSSTIETAAGLAETSNLEKAITTLQDAGTPPAAVASWIEKAKARLALDQAMSNWAPAVMQQAAGP